MSSKKKTPKGSDTLVQNEIELVSKENHRARLLEVVLNALKTSDDQLTGDDVLELCNIFHRLNDLERMGFDKTVSERPAEFL